MVNEISQIRKDRHYMFYLGINIYVSVIKDEL